MSVTKLYPANAAENPDYVLEQAVGVYDSVLILGWNKNEELDVRASLNVSTEAGLFLMEAYKHAIFSDTFE